MARRKIPTDHENMTLSLANHLSDIGHTDIKADAGSYTRPNKIIWKRSGDGHIPDVTSVQDGLTYIFEVETSDTIDDPHTEDQWKLFASFAAAGMKKFIVVVPYKNEKYVNYRAEELGIKIDDIWEVELE